MMDPRLRFNIRRLAFVLFQSLGLLAYWLALVAALAAIASLIFHERGGRLLATMLGGAGGSLFSFVPMLPYELRLEPADMREGLIKVAVYLARSNMTPVRAGALSQIGAGNGMAEWVPNRSWPKWWPYWKGNTVEVSVEGSAVVVRGPRSMIKPLWRNFRGPWRKMLAPA